MQSKIISSAQLDNILDSTGFTDVIQYVDFLPANGAAVDSIQISSVPGNKKGFRIVDHDLNESPSAYHRVSALVGGLLSELKDYGAEIDARHGFQYVYFNRYTKAEVCYKLKLTRIRTYVNSDWPHETSWLVAEKTG